MANYQLVCELDDNTTQSFKLADWGDTGSIPKDYLETRVIEYKGEPLDDDWQEYQCEVLDIQGDIVDWQEA